MSNDLRQQHIIQLTAPFHDNSYVTSVSILWSLHNCSYRDPNSNHLQCFYPQQYLSNTHKPKGNIIKTHRHEQSSEQL